MFCAHPSCQRDVDINSVATNQIRGAVTFDNPNSEFNPTIVKSNSNIVNVCKSCGESAYLYTNKKAYEMERHLAKLEAAEKEHDIKAAKVFFSNPIVTSVMGLLMLACYLLQAWDKGSIWFLEWSWEYDLMMSLLAVVSLLIAAICLPLAIFTTPGFLKAGGTKAWRQKVDSLRLEIEPNRTAKSPEYYKKRNLKKKKGKSTGKIKPSYYYHDVGSGEAKGPYTETELKSLERESQIDEFTQICEEGSDEWVNYNSKNLRRDLP